MKKLLSGARFRTAIPVDSRTIGLGIVLLFGVLIVAYGFFRDISAAMDLGIVITGTTSWMILTLALTSGRNHHYVRRVR